MSKTNCRLHTFIRSFIVIIEIILFQLIVFQSPTYASRVDIEEFINDGGIFPLLSIVLGVFIYMVIAYPVLFLINIFRLWKQLGVKNSKKLCFEFTQKCVHDFVVRILMIVIFIIPLGFLGLGVIFGVLNLFLTIVIGLLFKIDFNNLMSEAYDNIQHFLSGYWIQIYILINLIVFLTALISTVRNVKREDLPGYKKH